MKTASGPAGENWVGEWGGWQGGTHSSDTHGPRLGMTRALCRGGPMARMSRGGEGEGRGGRGGGGCLCGELVRC